MRSFVFYGNLSLKVERKNNTMTAKQMQKNMRALLRAVSIAEVVTQNADPTIPKNWKHKAANAYKAWMELSLAISELEDKEAIAKALENIES